MENIGQFLREQLSRLRELWSNLSLNQKVLIAGAVLLALAAIIVTSATLTKKEYEPLFTKLDVNDAAAVTAKLQELNVDYQLGDDGTTVLVLPEQKYQVRLQLASVGLPKGVAGFEIFNQSSLGETETDKRIKYQVALTGELTRTIESLNQIEFARVNLALPEKSLFTEQQQAPTASVLVKTRPYSELHQKEVQGIVHLLASSVEGLKPENVTVVDTNGNLLSVNLPEAESLGIKTELTAAQMALKRQYEKELQYSIQSMMEQVIGKGRALVRVTAELNFDEKESRKETFGPNSFVRSEKLLEESSTQTGEGEQGIPGTASNIPTYQEVTAGTGSSASDKSEKIRNYEIDREEINQRFAQGDVKRLTVSVIIDKELDNRQRDELQEIVANAAGFNAERGDTISVMGMKFSQPPPSEEQVAMDWVRWGWIIPLVVLILALLIIWLVQRRRREETEEGELTGFDALIDEEISIEELVERELTPEEKERKKVREEIEKLIDTNPEAAAQMLRTWLLEDAR